ncbi:hypothetical protein FS749_008253 [Ceratobasidium sp. UAMH 11750]|nr:hypothetical protein FS749_008253 [Ceratobasidium sp. UAMH 11750]
MPQVYDRVDAVVRLSTTNPFNTSGRGMSQGEYCYTGELPESERQPGDSGNREARKPGVTVLPDFNPHPPEEDTGRRQRRRDGREDPPSRRRRDFPASPTPIRRRVRDTEQYPTPTRRQTYRDPSPLSEPAYAEHPVSDEEYQTPQAPPVARSSRLAKQASSGRASSGNRQPLPDSYYPEHSDEDAYPAPSVPKMKNRAWPAPTGNAGGFDDRQERIPSSKNGKEVQVVEPPEQEQTFSEEGLIRGQAAYTESKQVQPASATVNANIEPAIVLESAPIAVSANGEKTGNMEPPREKSNGYLSEPGQPSQPSQPSQPPWPPWYWPPFASQPQPPNQTPHDLCPSCAAKSAPKVCESCHTSFTPNKLEPSNPGTSNDQPAKSMDESDVREMVKSELDRLLKENKLLEGLAGRVVDAIRPELSTMVSNFAQEVAAALPALVPAQPSISVPTLTLDPSPAAPVTSSAPSTFRSASIPMTPISPVPVHTPTPVLVDPVPGLVAHSPPAREPEPVLVVANGPDSVLDSVPVPPLELAPQINAPELVPPVYDPPPLALKSDSAPTSPPTLAVGAVPEFDRAPESAPILEAQVGQTEGGADKDEVSKVDAEVREPVVQVEEPLLVGQAASGVGPVEVQGVEAVAPSEGKDNQVVGAPDSVPLSVPGMTPGPILERVSDIIPDSTPASNLASEPAMILESPPAPAPSSPLAPAPAPLDPVPTVNQASVPVVTGEQLVDPDYAPPADSAPISMSEASPGPLAVPASDEVAAPPAQYPPVTAAHESNSAQSSEGVLAVPVSGLDVSIMPTLAPAPVQPHEVLKPVPELAVLPPSNPAGALESALNPITAPDSASGIVVDEPAAQTAPVEEKVPTTNQADEGVGEERLDTPDVEVAGEVGLVVPVAMENEDASATELGGVTPSEEETDGTPAPANIDTKGDLEPVEEPAREQIDTSGVVAPMLEEESKGNDMMHTALAPTSGPSPVSAALYDPNLTRNPLLTPLPASPVAPTLDQTPTPAPEAVPPLEPASVQPTNPPMLPTVDLVVPVSPPVPAATSEPSPGPTSAPTPTLAIAPDPVADPVSSQASVLASEPAPVSLVNPVSESTLASSPVPAPAPSSNPISTPTSPLISTPITAPVPAQAPVFPDAAPAPAPVPVADACAAHPVDSQATLPPTSAPVSGPCDVPVPISETPIPAPGPEVPCDPAPGVTPTSTEGPSSNPALDLSSEPAFRSAQSPALDVVPAQLPHAPSSIPELEPVADPVAVEDVPAAAQTTILAPDSTPTPPPTRTSTLVPDLEPQPGPGAVPILAPTSEPIIDSVPAQTQAPVPTAPEPADLVLALEPPADLALNQPLAPGPALVSHSAVAPVEVGPPAPASALEQEVKADLQTIAPSGLALDSTSAPDGQIEATRPDKEDIVEERLLDAEKPDANVATGAVVAQVGVVVSDNRSEDIENASKAQLSNGVVVGKVQDTDDTAVSASADARGDGKVAAEGPEVKTGVFEAPMPTPGIATEKNDEGQDPALIPLPVSGPVLCPIPNLDLIPVLELAPVLDLSASPAPTPVPVASHTLGSDPSPILVPATSSPVLQPQVEPEAVLVLGPAPTPIEEGTGSEGPVERAKPVHQGVVVVKAELDGTVAQVNENSLADEDEIEIGGEATHAGTATSTVAENPSVGTSLDAGVSDGLDAVTKSAEEQEGTSDAAVPTPIAGTERKDSEHIQQDLAPVPPPAPAPVSVSASSLEPASSPVPPSPQSPPLAHSPGPGPAPDQTSSSSPIKFLDLFGHLPTLGPAPAPAPAPTHNLDSGSTITLRPIHVLALPSLFAPAPVTDSSSSPVDASTPGSAVVVPPAVGLPLVPISAPPSDLGSISSAPGPDGALAPVPSSNSPASPDRALGPALSRVTTQPSVSAPESEPPLGPRDPDPSLDVVAPHSIPAPAPVAPTRPPASTPDPAPAPILGPIPVPVVDSNIIPVSTQSAVPTPNSTPAPTPAVQLEPEAKPILSAVPTPGLTPEPNPDPTPIYGVHDVPTELNKRHADEGLVGPSKIEADAGADEVVTQVEETPSLNSAGDRDQNRNEVGATEKDETRPNEEGKTNNNSSVPNVGLAIGSAPVVEDTKERSNLAIVAPAPEVKVEGNDKGVIVQDAAFVPAPEPTAIPVFTLKPVSTPSQTSAPASALILAPSGSPVLLPPLVPMPDLVIEKPSLAPHPIPLPDSAPGSPLVLTPRPGPTRSTIPDPPVVPVVSALGTASAATLDPIPGIDSSDPLAHEPAQSPVPAPSSASAPPSGLKPQAEPAPDVAPVLEPIPAQAAPVDPEKEYVVEHPLAGGRVEDAETSGPVALADMVAPVHPALVRSESREELEGVKERITSNGEEKMGEQSVSSRAGPESSLAATTEDAKERPNTSDASVPAAGAGAERKDTLVWLTPDSMVAPAPVPPAPTFEPGSATTPGPVATSFTPILDQASGSALDTTPTPAAAPALVPAANATVAPDLTLTSTHESGFGSPSANDSVCIAAPASVQSPALDSGHVSDLCPRPTPASPIRPVPVRDSKASELEPVSAPVAAVVPVPAVVPGLAPGSTLASDPGYPPAPMFAPTAAHGPTQIPVSPAVYSPVYVPAPASTSPPGSISTPTSDPVPQPTFEVPLTSTSGFGRDPLGTLGQTAAPNANASDNIPARIPAHPQPDQTVEDTPDAEANLVDWTSRPGSPIARPSTATSSTSSVSSSSSSSNEPDEEDEDIETEGAGLPTTLELNTRTGTNANETNIPEAPSTNMNPAESRIQDNGPEASIQKETSTNPSVPSGAILSTSNEPSAGANLPDAQNADLPSPANTNTPSETNTNEPAKVGVDEIVDKNKISAAGINPPPGNSNSPLTSELEAAPVPIPDLVPATASKPETESWHAPAPVLDPVPTVLSPTPELQAAGPALPTVILESDPIPVLETPPLSAPKPEPSPALAQTPACAPAPTPVPAPAPASAATPPSASRRARVLGLALKFAFVPVGTALPPVPDPAPPVPAIAVPTNAPEPTPTSRPTPTPESRPASCPTSAPGPSHAAPVFIPAPTLSTVPAPGPTPSTTPAPAVTLGSAPASEPAPKLEATPAPAPCSTVSGFSSSLHANPTLGPALAPASDPAPVVIPKVDSTHAPGLAPAPVTESAFDPCVASGLAPALASVPARTQSPDAKLALAPDSTQGPIPICLPTRPVIPQLESKSGRVPIPVPDVAPTPAPGSAPEPASDLAPVPAQRAPAAPADQDKECAGNNGLSNVGEAKPDGKPDGLGERVAENVIVGPKGGVGGKAKEAKEEGKTESSGKQSTSAASESTRAGAAQDPGNKSQSPKPRVKTSGTATPLGAETGGGKRRDWRDLAPTLLSTLAHPAAAYVSGTPGLVLAPARVSTPDPSIGRILSSQTKPAPTPDAVPARTPDRGPVPVPAKGSGPVAGDLASIAAPKMSPIASAATHTSLPGVTPIDSVPKPAIRQPATPAPTQSAWIATPKPVSHQDHENAHPAFVNASEALLEVRKEHQDCDENGKRNGTGPNADQTKSSARETTNIAPANTGAADDASIRTEDTEGKSIFGTVVHVFATSKEKVEGQLLAFGSLFGSSPAPASAPLPTPDLSATAPLPSLAIPAPVLDQPSNPASDAATFSCSTSAPSHEPVPGPSLGPVAVAASTPVHVAAPVQSPGPHPNAGPASTPILCPTRTEPELGAYFAPAPPAVPVPGPTPVQEAQVVAQTMIVGHNETGKRRVEAHIETGVQVDRKESLNQKVNRTMDGRETVETTWTRSESSMPAPASAEVRYDVDFIAENPVGWANTSSALAFTLGTAYGRTNERQVWRNAALTTSDMHNSALVSEQTHGTVASHDVPGVPDSSFVPAHRMAVSNPAANSERDAIPGPRLVSAPTYATGSTLPHDLVPAPSVDLEQAISRASTSGPVRVVVRAPTRNLGPDTFVAPMPSPSPVSSPALESMPNQVHYPVTPPASTYAASPVPTRASAHRSIATPTASQLSPTPASVHAFVPDPAASHTPGPRPVSLPVPSPTRPRKYLYASRRSVPASSGSAFAPHVVQDSVFAFTTDSIPDSAPTLPTSGRAPPPAPIRVFSQAIDPRLMPVATSTPVRSYESSPVSESTLTSARVSASTPAFGETSVQSGPDAMSALDSAIWAIDSAIFALDMVSILGSSAEASQDEVPAQNPAPPQEPLPAQGPVPVRDPAPIPTSPPVIGPVLPQTPVRAPLAAPVHTPEVAPILDSSMASELALALSTELPVASPRSPAPSIRSLAASLRRPSSLRTPSRSSLRVASAQLRHQYSGHVVKDVDFWR